jgi:hypothetical protein
MRSMPIDSEIVKAQLNSLGDFYHFFTSKEIKYLPQILTEDEMIHGITSGFYENKTWLIVITDMRILFLDKGMLYGLKQIDLPITHISSISHKTGFFFGEIQVSTSSGGKTIKNIAKRDVLKISSIVAGLIHGGRRPKAASSAAQTPALQPTIFTPAARVDLASQLEKLADLHDRGVLTEEEFTLSKAKLIGLPTNLKSL